jgi:hypothetical protein
LGQAGSAVGEDGLDLHPDLDPVPEDEAVSLQRDVELDTEFRSVEAVNRPAGRPRGSTLVPWNSVIRWTGWVTPRMVRSPSTP